MGIVKVAKLVAKLWILDCDLHLFERENKGKQTKKKKRKSKNSESVETRQVSKYSVKSLYDVFIQNMDVDKNQKRDLQTFSGIGLIRKVDEN